MARRVGGRIEHLGEELLAAGIAVQDAALAAFFVIQHELHGDARVAGPSRMGATPAIAFQIPPINGAHCDAKRASMRMRVMANTCDSAHACSFAVSLAILRANSWKM